MGFDDVVYKLASDLEQFYADYDPYAYADSSVDKETNIQSLVSQLRKNQTEGIKHYLVEVIEEAEVQDYFVLDAQSLLSRLDKLASFQQRKPLLSSIITLAEKKAQSISSEKEKKLDFER